MVLKVTIKDSGEMDSHMVKALINLMILLNTKDSLLMVNHTVEENLQMICCVTKEFFMKECFKEKEWFFTSQVKLFKEFSNKIVF